ncbi:MAG TPA: SH3 domain-containing protein [Terriglobales bacterium]|nr:SH3 domain-containing protein [Terriglobales bacterium]
MYVSVPRVSLRDRVAALYTKVGTVNAGDRVEILERQKRFARVRTPAGQEGWLEQRYLVDQKVYDEIQKMTADAAKRPPQGTATARSQTNLHVAPGRDTEHIFQLEEGAKAQVLARATAEKPGAVAPVPLKAKKAQGGEEEKPQPVLEDFWLVRGGPERAGWVLARMLDLDVPLEIAQYAEGQRIVAYFVLNEVQDGDKKAAQYLVALTESKEGLPFDFNQVRVFTWNGKRHRYETAYRERNLFGLLPIRTGVEDFGKEGRLPVFSLRVQGEDGNTLERKYKLNTPIVRRVLVPGEQPGKSRRVAVPKAASAKKRKH